jgi:NAD(P)-dependent dehydrogenase (short-subunit alcohol dehydrogenase family)
MSSFENQRVLVFGGSTGIGLATARLAAEHGASTVIVSRSQARIDAALEQLPTGAEGYAADLTSEQQVQRMFAEVGAFDHLVYTAGENLVLSRLEQTDLGDARVFLETRMWGALSAVKHGQRQIKAGGSIVLMSGSASARPQANWTVAAAICGAMEAITRALAVELAPVRVNAVAPGIVRTDLWAGLSDNDREAMYAEAARTLPVRRAGEASDIAEAITYLMANGYTTGTTLSVDGGSVLI